MLIMIVEREKYRRTQNKSIEDTLSLAIELSFWAMEAMKISRIPVFKKGGVMKSK